MKNIFRIVFQKSRTQNLRSQQAHQEIQNPPQKRNQDRYLRLQGLPGLLQRQAAPYVVIFLSLRKNNKEKGRSWLPHRQSDKPSLQDQNL